MANKIKIIGAGIAGLTVGCHLQKKGFETEIYEKHSIPGGLCTSWKRGDYTFDGCVHWLLGSSSGSAFYKLWNELLDLKNMEFYNHDLRVAIEVKNSTDRNGSRIFYLYSDLNKLEQYMHDISPEDKLVIKQFIDSIRFLQKYEIPPLIEKAPEIRTLFDNITLLKYTPLLLHISKWSKITNYNLAKRFKSLFLKEAFELLFEGKEYSMLIMTMQLAYFDSKCAGYPIGGSMVLSKKLEESYIKLGGKIKYNKSVDKILVEDDKAVGIQTQNGEKHYSDYVVSAADWNFTVFKMLDGKYKDKTINSLYNQEALKVFYSVILVSLGINRSFENDMHLLRFPIEVPFELPDGTKFQRMEAHIYNYDRTMAPDGKTVLSITLSNVNPNFWIELRKTDMKKYRELKEEIAGKVIEILEKKYGDIKDKVEASDVATPATFYRYTGNWQGSIQGWMPADKLFSKSPVKNTLPGLKNFYMTGHWLEPGGGLPIALMTGRNTAQVIASKEKGS